MRYVAFLTLAVVISRPPAFGQVNLPEGFEVVEIERTDLGILFPRINNCAQIVVTRALEGDLREVFLYDNGSFVRVTHNSRPDRSNGLPDINDHATIVWSRFDRNSSDGQRIFVYRDGRRSRLWRGSGARINNHGHMTWERFRREERCQYVKAIMFYDGVSTVRVYRSKLTDQEPELNDVDQITWMHTDFCKTPWWEGDIRLYSEGEVFPLPSREKQVQGATINNLRQVAWNALQGIEIWEDGETRLLTEVGNLPALNNLGDLYFRRFDPERGEGFPWVYRVEGGNPRFYRLSDDEFRHLAGDINDWGEVVWRFTERGSIAGGLRLMRRIRTGDAEFDGDVDLVDYAAFADCMTGPGRVDRLCDCRFLDIDDDGDVDLSDFALFQNAFMGK